MQRGTLTNGFLLGVAVLLAVNVMFHLGSSNIGPQEAAAQNKSYGPPSRDSRRADDPKDVPNQARQLERILTALERLESKLEANTRMLESGKMKVEVTNLSDISVNVSQ